MCLPAGDHPAAAQTGSPSWQSAPAMASVQRELSCPLRAAPERGAPGGAGSVPCSGRASAPGTDAGTATARVCCSPRAPLLGCVWLGRSHFSPQRGAMLRICAESSAANAEVFPFSLSSACPASRPLLLLPPPASGLGSPLPLPPDSPGTDRRTDGCGLRAWPGCGQSSALTASVLRAAGAWPSSGSSFKDGQSTPTRDSSRETAERHY